MSRLLLDCRFAEDAYFSPSASWCFRRFRLRLWIGIVQLVLDQFWRDDLLLFFLNGFHWISEATQWWVCLMERHLFSNSCLISTPFAVLNRIFFDLYFLYRSESPDIYSFSLAFLISLSFVHGSIHKVCAALFSGLTCVQPATANVKTFLSFDIFKVMWEGEVLVQVLLLGCDIVICAQLLPILVRVVSQHWIANIVELFNVLGTFVLCKWSLHIVVKDAVLT